MRRLLIAILLLSLAAFAQRGAKPTKLLPIDEAAKDPSFLAFRTELIKAVEKRDAAAVKAILDPKIQIDDKGVYGPDTFIKLLKIDNPKAEFWTGFEQLLKMGGRWRADKSGKTGPRFVAPYIYTDWPAGYDKFEYGAIAGANVKVLTQPKTGAPVLLTASHDIVTIFMEDDSVKGDFQEIGMLSGQRGWVRRSEVRSALDFHAAFQKRGEKWMLVKYIMSE